MKQISSAIATSNTPKPTNPTSPTNSVEVQKCLKNIDAKIQQVLIKPQPNQLNFQLT